MLPNIIKLQQSFENRRSIYALNNTLPVSQQAVIDVVEHAILHTPSAFNSQTTRIVVLFDDEHKRLWDLTENKLRAIVADGDFSATEQKMNGFRSSAGTVLYFEDKNDVKMLQEQFMLYAESFPVWSEHSSAMHQYVIWTALSAMGIGANLQHYAPVVEQELAQAFNIPSHWQLIAQMPFGGIEASAGDKEFKSISERLRILGQDQ